MGLISKILASNSYLDNSKRTSDSDEQKSVLEKYQELREAERARREEQLEKQKELAEEERKAEEKRAEERRAEELKAEKLAEENRELQKELSKAKEDAARGKFASFVSKAQEIAGGKLFISKVDDSLDGNELKTGADLLSERLGESVVVLANARSVIAKVSDSFVTKGINAGKIVGDIARATGANGGGRPNFAQGGVKDSSNLDEILGKIEQEIKA